MPWGAQTLPFIRPGPSAHHLQQWPHAFLTPLVLHLSGLSSTRHLSQWELYPSLVGPPSIRHELFARSLQHQLILAREQIRPTASSSYFQCNSQMKSDSSFPGWICLGKFRLLLAGSVGSLVLFFIVTAMPLNENRHYFCSLLQMPLLFCNLLIPLYPILCQRGFPAETMGMILSQLCTLLFSFAHAQSTDQELPVPLPPCMGASH